MQRRIWFLMAVAAAVLGLAGSAAAMTAGSGANSSARAGSYVKAWASVPRTPAAREAKKTMVFGLEQTVTGFNLNDFNENAFYAAIVAGTPIIRGNYLVDAKGNEPKSYHLDLASKVVANKKFLKIWIRKDANWYWVGHKKPIPVTAADYIYTWKQIIDPANEIASSAGFSNIARAKVNSKKVVTFYWKKGQPFADWRDLFGYVYPGFALKGQKFNDYWHDCVCGNDGKPITDGPFYMSSYTPGQGMVLVKNKHWYGKKAGLNKIFFRMITDTNAEIQAMRGGEVDAIAPSPESALSTLVHQSNLKYSAIPSFGQEHWDIEVNPAADVRANWNPLLAKQYIRAAISEGMDRQSLITALYKGIAKIKPLNNPDYEIGPTANGKHAYFSKYNFNPKKAIATLKSHGCTGGPSSPSSSNTKVWTCGGRQTVFRFDTTSRASRVQSSQIFKQELMEVGIKLNVNIHGSADFFGTILPNTDFDLGEYAWTGSPDPSGFDGIYQCYNAQKNLGGSNYKRYCNKKVDKLIAKADVNFNTAQRTSQYEEAAKIEANQLAIIPLYQSPQIFVYKKSLKGASKSNNPTAEGPTWNIEQWHW